MTSLLHLCVILPFIAVTNAQGWKKRGPYDTLTANLLEGYNSNNPPFHNQSTTVQLSLVLQSITKLDEFAGTFSAVAWQRLLWTDIRFTWNASNYDGIDTVRFPAWQIWKPDIMLYNSVEERKPLLDADIMAYPEGTMYQIVPIHIKTSCYMDLKKYPYDVQVCKLIWGPWMQDNTKISLTTPDEELNLKDYTPNPIWDVMKTSLEKNLKEYECCPDKSYEDITVSILMRRRHPNSLIASAVIATWMILVVFLIAPPSYLERIVFAGFIFVSLIIVSSWLSTTVPSYTSTNLGRFVIFGMMITAMITVLLAVCHGLYPRREGEKGGEILTSPEDVKNERRRRYFRMFDLGAMSFIVMLLSIMTGSLFGF